MTARKTSLDVPLIHQAPHFDKPPCCLGREVEAKGLDVLQGLPFSTSPQPLLWACRWRKGERPVRLPSGGDADVSGWTGGMHPVPLCGQPSHIRPFFTVYPVLPILSGARLEHSRVGFMSREADSCRESVASPPEELAAFQILPQWKRLLQGAVKIGSRRKSRVVQRHR